MFNFFDEIKKNVSKIDNSLLGGYTLVNISGKILYAEGHIGLTTLSKEVIVFKVKGGRIICEGKDLVLDELSENTLKIVGQISKVEAF